MPGAFGDDVLISVGRLDPDVVDTLQAHAREGGAVLLVPEPDDPVAGRLAGVCAERELARTEWFVTLTDHPAAARLDGEVPVTTGLRPLRPAAEDVEIVATTSIRFVHEPAVAVRRVGAGLVVSTSVTDLDALADHHVLGTFVRRLLHRSVPSRSSDLGVGIVGYGPFGGMGHLHGMAATETDGLAIVAAADSAPERLGAARQDFPGLTTHPDAASLAHDPAVDVAVIATPPVFHAEIALELLRAGKHVVIEKPMCLDPEQADEVIATAAAHDRTVTVHQSRRWDRDWLALRRIVDRGEIGDVFNIETFVGGFEHPCRAWHSEESISGGAVYDWGSHHVDWILGLHGGPPRRVLCTTHSRVWHDSSNVDQLSLWMQWDDGREATFRQSDVCAIRRPKFHVEGTSGTIEGHYRPLRTDRVEPGRGHVEEWSHHAEAPVDLAVATFEGGAGIRQSTVVPAPHPGWAFHRNLADHLLLGEPLAVLPEQSRDVVAVLHAAHRSGRCGGEPIELG